MLAVSIAADASIPSAGGGATTAALMYCAGKEPITVGKPEKAMLDSIVET